MDQVLKQEMDHLKVEFGEVSSKMAKVYDALLGNDLTKDGGLIGRIIELEKEVRVLELRIDELAKKEAKADTYIRILWAMAGALVTCILGFALSLIFKP